MTLQESCGLFMFMGTTVSLYCTHVMYVLLYSVIILLPYKAFWGRCYI